MKYIDPNLIKSLANILYIMITNGPVNLKPLKYYVKGYKNRVKVLQIYKPCPVVVIFFKNEKKKTTSVGWSSRCKFFWNVLDPTVVIFFEIQKKN